MHNRFLSAALTLASLLPVLVLAQPLAAQRDGSWEFTVGGGGAWVDRALAGYLGTQGFSTDTGDPSHIVPAVALRLGYNVSENFGISFGASGATGSGVKYMTPFAAGTFTVNLNASTSPFLTFGTQFTRVTGENKRVTHPTWGAHLGVGLRSMLGERVALRIEGRMGFEHYAELPAEKTAYNSIATLGLSFFTAGRRAPPPVVMAAPACPVCARARVDTVWRVDTIWRTAVQPAPPPIVYVDTVVIVLRDTLVLEGINFEHNSAALTRESYVILNRVVRAMMQPEWVNTRWEIAGHTSSSGSDAYNLALSHRRAESVRAYLVSQGIADRRLVARGYGEKYPMYPTTAATDFRNRRVELRRIKP